MSSLGRFFVALVGAIVVAVLLNRDFEPFQNVLQWEHDIYYRFFPYVSEWVPIEVIGGLFVFNILVLFSVFYAVLSVSNQTEG